VAHTDVETHAHQSRQGDNDRARKGLLLTLAIDNFGSGLLLPLVLIYSVQVVGLSVALAGMLLFVGSLIGLIAPVLVGAVVDRVGPRRVVIASQAMQATGMAFYLLAGVTGTAGAASGGSATTVALATVGAVLVAAGTQTFYSSLFSLIAAVAGQGPKDKAFAHVDMVRSAAFGIGALSAAAMLTWLDAPALRAAVALNAFSFVIAAALLWKLVRVQTATATTQPDAATNLVTPGVLDGQPVSPPAPDSGSPGSSANSAQVHAKPGEVLARTYENSGQQPEKAPTTGAARPWRDRPFVVLLVVIALTGLATDVFLVGFSVWALDRLQTPAWIPGACVALLTAIGSTCTAVVVRSTMSWKRTRTVATGAALTVAWCAMCALAPLVTTGWRPAWLLASTLVLAVSAMLVGTRVMAMAEASAPVVGHGRYMATVQYSHNTAQLLAPLLVGLFAVAVWAPWVAVALAATGAVVLLPWLSRRLPAKAVRAELATAA